MSSRPRRWARGRGRRAPENDLCRGRAPLRRSGANLVFFSSPGTLPHSISCSFARCPERMPMAPNNRLEFEKDIVEMEDLLARLEASSNGQLTNADEVRRIRRELANL